MNIYDLSKNDEELTELRQSLNSVIGFPIWLVTVINTFTNEVVVKELFFSIQAMEKFISYRSSIEECNIELLYAKDVTEVSYKL